MTRDIEDRSAPGMESGMLSTQAGNPVPFVMAVRVAHNSAAPAIFPAIIVAASGRDWAAK
jgi:hypothetical protein